jgi:uncharacterized repeat protein (TIGR01451 family)
MLKHQSKYLSKLHLFQQKQFQQKRSAQQSRNHRWVRHSFEIGLLTSTFLLPLGLLNPQAARAANCSAGTITRVSSPILYIDTGITPAARGMYVGYRITNNGPDYADLWVKLEGFTGSIVSLSPNEDGIMHVGPLASGASKTVYFFVTATGATTAAQPHTVSLYSTRPDLTSATCGDPFSLTVEETIKAVANKIITSVTGPNPPELGGIMTMTITGETGTIGAAGKFATSPASFLDWPANSYQLVGTQISMSGGNTINASDSLYFTGLNSSSTNYTIVYTFIATGSTVAPTTVSPISQISSGTQIKHNDTGTGALSPIPPTVNNLTLSKSANPNTLPVGGTVTYTITLSNNGTVPVTLDDIVDVLPSTPGLVSYVAGSAKFNGSAIADPIISGQTLTFFNLFTAPAGSTSTLTYQATVPNTLGTYINRAVGHIGSTQIDTTTATTDNAPATANVSVGSADLTIAKTHVGDFTQGQIGATYTLTVNNIGAATTSGTVTAIDTLPSGLIATAASGSGWNCTLNQPASGQVQCTRSDALATGNSYPPITVTVNVAANASASVTNTVNVMGGGETNVTNNTATDPTIITPSVSIEGRVWNDANGSANNTFSNINNGSEPGTNAGGLNAILVNSTGNIIATTPVAADGTYTFTSVTTNQNNVTLRLSLTAGAVGQPSPTAAVPTGWIGTSPLTTAAFNIGTTSITSRDFGIRTINSDLAANYCQASKEFLFILDDSSSVDATEVQQQRDAVMAMLNHIANNGLSIRAAIVGFDANQRTIINYTDVTAANLASFQTALNTNYGVPGSGTNWEAGFQQGISLGLSTNNPDVTFFFTDGFSNSGGSPIDEANQFKLAGSHIYGIWIDSDPALTVESFKEITDGAETVEFNSTNSSTADYVKVSNYSELPPKMTALIQGVCSGKPNLLLVKRITQVNGSTLTESGDNLATYINESGNFYDDNTLDNPVAPARPDTDKWPTPSTFLIGGINGGNVRPGDELEYTIYFLSAGNSDATNVLFCDRVPSNVSFMPTAFNTFSQKAANGLAGDRGILAQINGISASYSNIQDGDNAQYFPPGINPASIYPKVNCGGNNTYGAIVINLGNLPPATAPATPGSYGWIRFKGKVK